MADLNQYRHLLFTIHYKALAEFTFRNGAVNDGMSKQIRVCFITLVWSQHLKSISSWSQENGSGRRDRVIMKTFDQQVVADRFFSIYFSGDMPQFVAPMPSIHFILPGLLLR